MLTILTMNRDDHDQQDHHDDQEDHLSSGLPGRLCFGCHRSHQLGRNSHILHLEIIIVIIMVMMMMVGVEGVGMVMMPEPSHPSLEHCYHHGEYAMITM